MLREEWKNTKKLLPEIQVVIAYTFAIFFIIQFINVALLSRSLPVVTQIKGDLLSPPHFDICLAFYREKKSAFSSLVDSRRIALLATLLVALSS